MHERANISEEKIREIATLAGCPVGEAETIIDPEYTYWSQRGDSTKEEHFAYLEHSSAEEITGWVQSICRERESES